MRDVNRIKPMMDKLAEIWQKQCPDWRFCQFISNVLSNCDFDPFYLEDDEFMELVKKTIGKCI